MSPDRVVIMMGDTAIVPFDSSTSASRSTVFMGNAVIKGLRAASGGSSERSRLVRSALDESSVEVAPGR